MQPYPYALWKSAAPTRFLHLFGFPGKFRKDFIGFKTCRHITLSLNACPMCLEDFDHLFLHCPGLDFFRLQMLDGYSFQGSSFRELSREGRLRQRFAVDFHAVIWSIYLERIAEAFITSRKIFFVQGPTFRVSLVFCLHIFFFLDQ